MNWKYKSMGKPPGSCLQLSTCPDSETHVCVNTASALVGMCGIYTHGRHDTS